MNGGFTTAHLGTIHKVVVKERVVVIHLYGSGCRKRIFIAGLIHIVRQEGEHGANTLAPHLQGIRYRFVKSLGLGGERNVVNKLFDFVQHIEDFIVQICRKRRGISDSEINPLISVKIMLLTI